MIKTVWTEIADYYDGFEIDKFIVMPNHIHGIIEIIVIFSLITSPKMCW